MSEDAEPLTDEEMRAALSELITKATSTKLERVYKRVCIVKKRPRQPRRDPTRPPLSAWEPKHLSETRDAMALLKEGVGLRRAPYPIGDDDGLWENKWFCSDVAQLIQHKSGRSIGRSARATCALAVQALASRVVEEAKMAMEGEDSPFRGAKIGLQKAFEDPGWDKVKTRGSGIVFNAQGGALFRLALDRVADRLGKAAE